ncbi:uncharacterized protein B0P05DRAFT_539514, partial [Gilbertella persicaria]|uniref:uncharacterized protein n=1 Tax=Gilbertella persicaria TaxID=101096 RepID=UPI00221FC6B5
MSYDNGWQDEQQQPPPLPNIFNRLGRSAAHMSPALNDQHPSPPVNTGFKIARHYNNSHYVNNSNNKNAYSNSNNTNNYYYYNGKSHPIEDGYHPSQAPPLSRQPIQSSGQPDYIKIIQQQDMSANGFYRSENTNSSTSFTPTPSASPTHPVYFNGAKNNDNIRNFNNNNSSNNGNSLPASPATSVSSSPGFSFVKNNDLPKEPQQVNQRSSFSFVRSNAPASYPYYMDQQAHVINHTPPPTAPASLPPVPSNVSDANMPAQKTHQATQKPASPQKPKQAQKQKQVQKPMQAQQHEFPTNHSENKERDKIAKNIQITASRLLTDKTDQHGTPSNDGHVSAGRDGSDTQPVSRKVVLTSTKRESSRERSPSQAKRVKRSPSPVYRKHPSPSPSFNSDRSDEYRVRYNGDMKRYNRSPSPSPYRRSRQRRTSISPFRRALSPGSSSDEEKAPFLRNQPDHYTPDYNRRPLPRQYRIERNNRPPVPKRPVEPNKPSNVVPASKNTVSVSKTIKKGSEPSAQEKPSAQNNSNNNKQQQPKLKDFRNHPPLTPVRSHNCVLINPKTTAVQPPVAKKDNVNKVSTATTATTAKPASTAKTASTTKATPASKPYTDTPASTPSTGAASVSKPTSDVPTSKPAKAAPANKPATAVYKPDSVAHKMITAQNAIIKPSNTTPIDVDTILKPSTNGVSTEKELPAKAESVPLNEILPRSARAKPAPLSTSSKKNKAMEIRGSSDLGNLSKEHSIAQADTPSVLENGAVTSNHVMQQISNHTTVKKPQVPRTFSDKSSFQPTTHQLDANSNTHQEQQQQQQQQQQQHEGQGQQGKERQDQVQHEQGQQKQSQIQPKAQQAQEGDLSNDKQQQEKQAQKPTPEQLKAAKKAALEKRKEEERLYQLRLRQLAIDDRDDIVMDVMPPNTFDASVQEDVEVNNTDKMEKINEDANMTEALPIVQAEQVDHQQEQVVESQDQKEAKKRESEKAVQEINDQLQQDQSDRLTSIIVSTTNLFSESLAEFQKDQESILSSFASSISASKYKNTFKTQDTIMTEAPSQQQSKTNANTLSVTKDNITSLNNNSQLYAPDALPVPTVPIVSSVTSLPVVPPSTPVPTPAKKRRGRLPRPWKVVLSDDGDMFYYNPVTGEQSSVRP